MASQSAIKLTKLVERFELEVLNQGKNYDRCLIRADDINRPALQILGFFDYFAPDRIQVIGKVEWTYLNNQSPEERRKCFDAFLETPENRLIPEPPSSSLFTSHTASDGRLLSRSVTASWLEQSSCAP